MGVRFISVTDRFDSLRDDADISIQLKNFANEAYARDISKKIRAVKRTQQLAGKWTTGTPPYGYMLDPDDKYHLFPDPQTGPIVLAIFRMVAENHTLHFIAKTLNEQGVPSPGRYLYDIGLRKTEKFKMPSGICKRSRNSCRSGLSWLDCVRKVQKPAVRARDKDYS